MPSRPARPQPTAPAAPRSLRLVPDRATGPGQLTQPDQRTQPTQLSLPYEYEVSPGVPAVPGVPSTLRAVTAEQPADVDPALPDIQRWAAQLARAISEVSVGERPPGQLTRWVARDVLTRLALRGQYVQRHPAARAQRGVSRLRAVRAVRACPVAPGIVETSAVIVGGDRAHAVAMRFEAVEGRWLATAVELG